MKRKHPFKGHEETVFETSNTLFVYIALGVIVMALWVLFSDFRF